MSAQPRKTHRLEIAGRTVSVALPADPDDLLEKASESPGGIDPYWGILWDASVVMAECLLRTGQGDEQSCLELGCGAGLVGIAGLMSGSNVTFSDIAAEAVDLAVHNASLNGFTAPGCVIDWRQPYRKTYDNLLACDVVYDIELHTPLLMLAENALRSGGSFTIGDPGRQQLSPFLKTAEERGWKIELQDADLQPTDGVKTGQFRLASLTRN